MLKRQIVADHGEGVLRSRLVMPVAVRNQVLERNQELRKNPDALRPLEWARWELSIPLVDYENFKRTHPDIFVGPAADRKAALTRFLATPESLPYRVRL